MHRAMYRGPWQYRFVWTILAILFAACASPETPFSPTDTATPNPLPPSTPAPKPSPTLTPPPPELQPEWSTYEPAQEILAKTEVRAIAIAPDGTVWLGTDDGPYHFDGQAWEEFTQGLPGIDVRSLSAGPAGGIWAGTNDGVARFTGDSWQQLREQYGRDEGEFADIAVAPDGALWFAKPLSIARFDGKDEWEIHYHPLGQDVREHILALAITEDGDFWFGTRVGAFHLDSHLQTLTSYTTDDGLRDNDVEAIAVAPDGTLWFATHSGVSRFDGETWTAYTQQDGLVGQTVLDIALGPDGTLWFVTDRAVCRYQPGGVSLAQPAPTKVFTPIPTYTSRPTRTPRPTRTSAPTPTPLPVPFRRVGPIADILPGDSPYLYSACDGTPWLVNSESVTRIDDASWSTHFTRTVAMLDNDTWRVYLTGITGTVVGVDASNRVWVANESYDEIAAWDGNAWTRYGPEEGWSPVTDTLWYDLNEKGRCDLAGNFWTVTMQDVRVFDGERWTVFAPKDMGMGAFSSDNYVVSLQVTIQQDTGDVWIGECESTAIGTLGGQGARRFDGTTWHGADSPAASGCVEAIEEDAEGNLWLGVDGVLWRYAPSQTWSEFVPPEIFPAGYRRHGSIPLLAADPYGRLWVATSLCGGANCDILGLYYVHNGVWTAMSAESEYYTWQLRPFTDKSGASWLFADIIYRLSETGIEPLIPLMPSSVVVDTAGRAWFTLRDYPQDILVSLD